MRQNRKRRLYWVFAVLAAGGIAVSLVIYALGQNINLYFTPSQLETAELSDHRLIRVGGMVQAGSVKRAAEGLSVSFAITDMKQQLPVVYEGVLPALFREGQGIVVQGVLKNGILQASEVLAKHDENYMPPGTTKES